jgi:hypothetical protein
MKVTAKYYATHPEARKKRLEYQKKYDKMDRQVKRRIELNRANRKLGQYADHDGKDLAHHKSGRLSEKLASKNRGDKNDSPGDVRARGKKKKK